MGNDGNAVGDEGALEGSDGIEGDDGEDGDEGDDEDDGDDGEDGCDGEDGEDGDEDDEDDGGAGGCDDCCWSLLLQPKINTEPNKAAINSGLLIGCFSLFSTVDFIVLFIEHSAEWFIKCGDIPCIDDLVILNITSYLLCQCCTLVSR